MKQFHLSWPRCTKSVLNTLIKVEVKIKTCIMSLKTFIGVPGTFFRGGQQFLSAKI